MQAFSPQDFPKAMNMFLGVNFRRQAITCP